MCMGAGGDSEADQECVEEVRLVAAQQGGDGCRPPYTTTPACCQSPSDSQQLPDPPCKQPCSEKSEAELSDPNHQENDKAGRAFIELLCHLSKVVVQDAPFLRRLVPDLYIWKHPLFSKPSYVAFEAKALAEAEIANTTVSEIMRRGMPELTDFLSTNFKAVFGALRQIDAKGQDTNASFVELRKTVLEERRSERYDALLAGIGDAFHIIDRDLGRKGPSGGEGTVGQVYHRQKWATVCKEDEFDVGVPGERKGEDVPTKNDSDFCIIILCTTVVFRATTMTTASISANYTQISRPPLNGNSR
ncbi:hypothetical protein I306_01451 [Cryptococcus gattii EJB2]|nr:hypothetical protein I306_01451 [Cryptococcus gattii EJB2]